MKNYTINILKERKIQKMNNESIGWINGMKGIAMCGVIMVHLGGSSLPSIMGHIGSIGKNGVQIFFLLSAYLTYCSLDKIFGGGYKLYHEKMSFKSVCIWWKKKFIKLIPIYYLMLIVCAVFEGGNIRWLGSEEHITFLNMLSHFLFIHGLFPHYTDSIIGVEWYLGALAIFYIMAPILYKYINSLEKSVGIFVVSIPMCYLVKECADLFLPAVEDVYIYETYIDEFGILAQLPVLLLGIVLFFALKSYDEQKIKEKRTLSYALLVFSLIMILGQAYQKNTLYMINEATIFGIWFLGISISQAIWQCPLIDNCVFRTIGKYSYPIYLIHFFFIQMFQKYYDLNIQNEILNWGLQYIIVLSISMAVSIVIIKFYDRPLLKWMNNFMLSKKE